MEPSLTPSPVAATITPVTDEAPGVILSTRAYYQPRFSGQTSGQEIALVLYVEHRLAAEVRDGAPIFDLGLDAIKKVYIAAGIMTIYLRAGGKHKVSFLRRRGYGGLFDRFEGFASTRGKVQYAADIAEAFPTTDAWYNAMLSTGVKTVKDHIVRIILICLGVFGVFVFLIILLFVV